MKDDVQIIYDLGLLSWRTAEIGFRRGWIDVESIEELAVLTVDRMAITDRDVAVLTGAGTLSRSEIQDVLGHVAHRLDADTEESTVLERWLLGRLISLRRKSLDDDWLLDRVEETYAEFGYPRALNGVTRYDLTPEERSRDLAVGDQATSPLEVLDRAVTALQERLIA